LSNLWSKDQLIIVFNLYCKMQFSKMHARNKEVQEAAALIGRSANAVALKLVNFASLDPELKARNIKGMSHAGKMDKIIWDEFHQNWDELIYQSEKKLAEYKKDTVEHTAGINLEDLPKEGKEREALVKTRVNQSLFRQAILASYNNKCCITGLAARDLLVASHIIPWSKDKNNRMNPCNGLCLNALHDRAFDKGLITITPDYYVKISEKLRKYETDYQTFFKPYENMKIMLPDKFAPKPEFLEIHNQMFI
jgi:putative restriction endonuclease